MTCVGLGVELASVHSLQENTFLYYLCGYNNDCWIGLTDEQVEGNWEWTDGSPVDYENWASGEGKNHWSQDYVHFRKNEKGQWYDSDKNFKAYAICEKNATVPFFYSSPCQGNLCYYKTPSKMTWDEANTTCLGLGAELASVHSLEKNTYLYILCGSENSCWIGFNDVAVEQEWVWSDGSNVEFTNWEKNEPNNQGNHEDYAVIEGKTSQWNDYGPAWKNAYAICQKSDTIPAIVWSECYGNSCFYKTSSKMLWTEANTTCVGLGVELASVHSLQENTYLFNLCGYDNDCWIGLTDEQVEGNWEWTDGSPFDYENWASGEGNNHGSQDYVHFRRNQKGKWYDNDKNFQAYAICMKSSPAPTETPTRIFTGKPTPLPSSDKTTTPTSVPTNYPTKLPTYMPTLSPSAFPTSNPTMDPSNSPTFDWSQCYAGSCYHKAQSPMTWEGADTFCRDLGAELASVQSPEENTFLYYLCGSDDYCWLGFSDAKEEGVWEWSDRSNVEYVNWRGNEPDNWYTQNYATLSGPDGSWNDMSYDRASTYAICEK